jgi:4-hydroxy-3-polyprenylbenzoate decarboxylase
VPLVRAKTVDLMVPAEAEFVLEGYVDPAERRREGPFGDHTGFYSLDDDFPVFHVTAITRRERPVYLTTIVGRPPMEDGFMGEAVERLFLPLVKKTIPRFTTSTCRSKASSTISRSSRSTSATPATRARRCTRSGERGQLMFTKTVVVVDADVDVRGGKDLLWRVLTAIDPERDVEIVHGPVDELDFASRLPCYGSKLGVDATRKWKEEGFARRWPDEIVMSDDVRRRVDALWPSLGIDRKGRGGV